MGINGRGVRHFWCLRHHRVETEADICAARYTLGPYDSAAAAAAALEAVAQRNDAWDAEDARWTGDNH